MLELIEDLGMLYPNETSKRKSRYGIFKCHCGKEFKTVILCVKSGATKSCGCLKNKQKITHGLTKHRLYDIWKQMVLRCVNPNNKNYVDYGARGITVCDEWLIIENFIKDMDCSFMEGLTLDRINPDGNYEPSNCRWATRTVQARNQRRLRITNTTGYRGVFVSGNKFLVSIRVDSKNVYLGTFQTKEEAAKIYDKYVIENNLEHTRNFN